MNNDCLYCQNYDDKGCKLHLNEPMEHRCLEYTQISQEEIQKKGVLIGF